MCTIVASICDSNPCQHGAQCDISADGFICTCISGYFGSRCECEYATMYGWPTLTVSLDYPFLFVIWTFVELQGAVVIVIVW